MPRTTPALAFLPSLLLLAGCVGGGSDTGDTGMVAGSDCQGVDEIQAPDVVDTPTEWSCTVRISGDIRVQDRLTIAPCTTVFMGDRMYVNEGGSIVAQGTADCPIHLTSPNGTPGPGDWRYINFEAGADNGNVLEHVVIEYGGNEHGIVTAEDSIGVAFRDVEVRHTEGIGMTLEDLDIQDFDRVSFSEIPSYPVRMHFSTLDEIEDISVADSVQEPRILGIMGSRGAVQTDTTISPQSVPYELSDVTFEADIHVEAGTTVKVQPEARFFSQDGGNLFLDGTADAPVVWESASSSPSPGDWQEITIDNSSGTASVFNHAVLRHGGSDGHGVVSVESDARITLTDTVFEDNATCDVQENGEVLGNSTYVACD